MFFSKGKIKIKDINNFYTSFQIKKNLRKKINCTFIIVTHNQSLAKKADRQIIINDGRIL